MKTNLPLRQLMVAAFCSPAVTSKDADYLEKAIDAYDEQATPFSAKAKRVAKDTLTRAGSKHAATIKN